MPQDTAISLVAKSVRDATAEDLESDYYDGGVLRSLLGFKSFLRSHANQIELHAEGRPQEDFTLGMPQMEQAERLRERTPGPQAFVVSGHLDSIQHSRKQFQLALSDGQVIPGRVDERF